MSADTNKRYRIKPQIAVVKISDGVELFNANTREPLRLEIAYSGIVDLLSRFDGTRDLKSIAEEFPGIDAGQLTSLARYLVEKKIFIENDCSYETSFFSKHYRTINTLEDYNNSHSEVINAFRKLSEKTVFVAGVGTVGSSIVEALSSSGVRKLILVDDDLVEESNLARQETYTAADVGSFKVDSVSTWLNERDAHEIHVIREKICPDFFHRHSIEADLLINCADDPNVDTTSRIIAEYAMRKSLPHIIGGGYNLHLTLIGQAVIPHQTACFECLLSEGREVNGRVFEGVAKLDRPERKIGSFGPLSLISAAVMALEAVKLLVDATQYLISCNCRLEYNIDKRDFDRLPLERRSDCDWCGTEGKFRGRRLHE